MPDEPARTNPSIKKGTLLAQPGQPLQFVESGDANAFNTPPSSADGAIANAITKTFKAYREASKTLLGGKYADQRELAPPNMREQCNITVLRCNDGMLVRYDLASNVEPKVRCGRLEASLAEIAPQFTEQVIHFPQDPQTYVPPTGGVELALIVTDSKTGATTVHAKIRPMIYARIQLPDGFKMPLPPSRPVCLASIHNEMDIQLGGRIVPSDKPLDFVGPGAEEFIAHSRFRLPVGWQTIEIYPPLGEQYWKPEYAANWAELDLLAAIAQRNAITLSLNALDGRGATRRHYAALLEEFERLLSGPEEPAHQFLKQHPELLCPTHDRYWSKLAFGDRVSDFVFREPYNDYLLVEIEAPYRELFRKDGQQREELTHAINQITDWIQYIADNKRRVEEELGLTGISANPRTLVVIGRSAPLTEDNRRKIASLQALHNKLRILTYDDLIASSRAHLEHILGPLSLKGQNVELYYFKAPPQPAK